MLLYMWTSCCKQWNVKFFTFLFSNKVLKAILVVFAYFLDLYFCTCKASNMHRILHLVIIFTWSQATFLFYLLLYIYIYIYIYFIIYFLLYIFRYVYISFILVKVKKNQQLSCLGWNFVRYQSHKKSFNLFGLT